MAVTAREYLMQYRAMRAQIDTLDEIIKQLRLEQQGIGTVEIRSAWPDGQPHGTGPTDPVGELAAENADRRMKVAAEIRERLEDLEIRQLRLRADAYTKMCEVNETIGMVEDSTQGQVLRKRYIDGCTFEQIAVDMSYSWRHIMRLHGQALAKVEEILKNHKK